VARGVIADELRRELIEAHIRVPPPSGTDVQEYYASYAETPGAADPVEDARPVARGPKAGPRARVERAARSSLA
jgi:hypothetical protein